MKVYEFKSTRRNGTSNEIHVSYESAMLKMKQTHAFHVSKGRDVDPIEERRNVEQPLHAFFGVWGDDGEELVECRINERTLIDRTQD